MANSSVNKEWVYYLILALLTLLFFYKLVLHPGLILNSSDAIASDMFHENTLLRSLQDHGQFPLWSNFHFSGVPLVGNPVIQYFYPPNLLSFLFPQNLFISYSFLIHIFLTGLFTYLFTRKIGLTRYGSLVSAVTFMFSAVVLGKVFPGHLGSIMAISLMPLLFYLLENLITQPNLKNSCFLAVAFVFQLLGGMLQFFYYSSLALAVYAIMRLFMLYKEQKTLKSIPKIVLLALTSVAVCCLLSSIYLLPIYQLSKESGRAGGLDFEAASHMSLDPRQLITLVIPNFFGSAADNTYWGSWENPWVSYMYLGILPLILALYGLLFKKTRYHIIFLILALLSLVFSLGRYTPLYNWAYHLIPGINMFRVPAEAIFFFCFSVSIFAGYGAVVLTEEHKISSRQSEKQLLKALSAFAIIAVLATSVIFIGKTPLLNYGKDLASERYYTLHPGGTDFEQRYLTKLEVVYSYIANGALWFTLLISLSFILIWLRLEKNLSRTLFAGIAVIIILADLWAFGLPLVNTRTIDSIYPETELFSFLREDGSRYRVLDLASYIPQNVLPEYGIESITGYDPFLLKDYLTFTNLAGNLDNEYIVNQNILTNIPLQYLNITQISNIKILSLLNTKYIISKEKTADPALELVLEKQDYLPEKEFDPFKHYSNQSLPLYIYQNKDLLPRAFIVGEIKVISERQQILEELKKDTFDPKKYVILEEQIGKPLKEPYYSDAVNITLYSPNKIILETNLDKPGLLVLSEIWQPGWKALDNGTPTKVYRADYILRATYLPAGYHRIELDYEPSLFRIGLILSMISLFLVIIIVVLSLKNREIL